jgi:hypothetical protein
VMPLRLHCFSQSCCCLFLLPFTDCNLRNIMEHTFESRGFVRFRYATALSVSTHNILVEFTLMLRLSYNEKIVQQWQYRMASWLPGCVFLCLTSYCFILTSNPNPPLKKPFHLSRALCCFRCFPRFDKTAIVHSILFFFQTSEKTSKRKLLESGSIHS